MGHLVDQVEVGALETLASKPPSTIITTASGSPTRAVSIITSTSTTTSTETTLTGAQHQQSQSIQLSQHRPEAAQSIQPLQHRPETALSIQPLQHRPEAVQQTQSKPKQRKLQFKLDDDEGSPDKKPKERIDDDETLAPEEESGWWAERVAMALGGMTNYRDAWYRSHTHLLHADGPLPHTWRLYIAALAVCRHEVSWLMQALLTDFRNAGGDIRWTSNLHHAPPKLYSLTNINNILAHRPWLLDTGDIEKLTQGEDRENSWSLGELWQALCIMTHFHTLAAFLHSCRLSNLHSSPKRQDGQGNTKPGNSSKMSPRNMKTRSSCPDSSQNNNTAIDAGSKMKSSVGSASEGTVRSYKHLTVDPSYKYIEVVSEEEIKFPSFCIQEYSWQDHGYAMCSRLLGEVGAYFDDRFTSALSVVIPTAKDHPPQSNAVDQLNNTISDQAQIKSGSLFTKALWNHVQWLLGINHDDCDYADLNKRLDPQVRDFVKTACCFPEKFADASSSPSTTNSVQTSLVETSVIVMEARLQSELLYALRAIMLHHC